MVVRNRKMIRGEVGSKGIGGGLVGWVDRKWLLGFLYWCKYRTL